MPRANNNKAPRQRIKPELQYKRFPALAKYIDRIGAEQLNFNRFIVKEYKGPHYYLEKAIIKIVNGEIVCTVEEYAPTEEEAQLIKGALLNAEFPKSIGARNLNGLKAMLPPNAELYRIVSRQLPKEEGNIKMVQQRIVNADGTKNYFPFSFFSDGEWRRMEPEGALPFWKPDEAVTNQIMVHEGAKAAQFVHDLTTNPARKRELAEHPWGRTFAQYEHWGILGGALAPHRADYEELKKVKPIEVVYFCDNDWNGKAVLQEFAKHYGGRLRGIKLDPRWKYGWDCADEMPGTLYNDHKQFIGPELESLMQPATMATEKLPNPAGKGPDITICRREFKEEWFHSIRPEVFIHTDRPNKILSATEFNNLVRPYSHVDDTARLLKTDDVSKGGLIQYNPSRKPGLHNENGGRCINTYWPSEIHPKPGSVNMFMDFMDHLFPNDADRHEMLKWCATLIARPDVKMHYGVLLMSEMQGVGKTTLGEKILQPLVGYDNCSIPNEHDITESQWNYWIAHKRLAIVNEIYAGSSAKAYNRLKSVITDQTIQVSQKFQAPYMVDNWVHVFACSNSKRALQIAMDDRRWLVPTCTELKKPTKYWWELNRWLRGEGGLQAIAHWAKGFVEEFGFVGPGQDAPASSAKDEAIEEGMSNGMRLVGEFLDRLKEDSKEALIVIDNDLVDLVRHYNTEIRSNMEHIEKPATLRRVAKHKGWFINEERIQLAGKSNPEEWRRIKLGSKMICSDPEDATQSPLKLARAERKPVKVIEAYERMKRI